MPDPSPSAGGIPAQIVRLGKLMFDLRLTDIAGGNISARQGDHLYITPTGAGQKWLWDLSPTDILRCPIHTDELLQHPLHSNESISHLAIYRAIPEAGAAIHAHPFHLGPFLAAGIGPKPLVLEAILYGELEFIPDMPLYAPEQGAAVVEKLAPRRELIARKAAAVLMPRHGIFIAGRDLLSCLDCLERIDKSAWTHVAARLVAPSLLES